MSEEEIRELARQERNRYYREYRAKNPDKVREINRRYWMKQAKRRASEFNTGGVHNAAENEDH